MLLLEVLRFVRLGIQRLRQINSVMQKFSFLGIFLIIIGVFLLLRNVLDLEIPFWDFLLPLLLILWGISMLVRNISKTAKPKKS
jgi:hypothetical protein